MKLNLKQFQILVALTERKFSQRELQNLLGYSLGTINKCIVELTDAGMLCKGEVTLFGLESLEPYRVKSAIFIAAGFGTRMVPITLNTPKPLVRVHGKRIIEGLIDACLAAEINDIYIVRGYLSEQFDALLYKYPMIKFLENPLFNEANNISSALVARNLLQNSYVLEADLVVSNPNIITKYHYTSDVLGIYKERTDDWCLTVNKDGYVNEEKIGGFNCYQMIGIYYINQADGLKLADHIQKAFMMPGGKERYWEQVMNVVYKGEYKIAVRLCNEEDIVEIDTFNELKAIDKTYDM